MRIQCTSCKKALEADDKTLSDHAASTVRCPSCGVTLLVDKRKKSAVGPDVRVAAEEEKPLAPLPSPEELEQTGPSGTQVALIATLYDIAEDHLRTKQRITERAAALSTLSAGAQEALDAMRVNVPPPSSDHLVHAVTAAPAERRLDDQLRGLNVYLQASRRIVDAASVIWRNVMARHRYTPIVSWQADARNAVSDAYGAVAGRAGDLAAHIPRLDDVQSGYETLVAQYRTQADSLQSAVSGTKSRITAVENERTAARTRLASLEETAAQNGTQALTNGGCVTLVAAVVAGVVAAASSGSLAPGWILFFLVLGGGLWLAWTTGYARNRAERERIEFTLSEIASNALAAERQLDDAERALDAHKAATPHVAAAASAWSLLVTRDFDGNPASRLEAERNVDEAASARTDAVATAASMSLHVAPAATAQPLAVAAGTPRTVGFVAPQVSAAVAATAISPAMAAVETPLADAVAKPAPTTNRRIAATIATAGVVIVVASYLIWSSFFSLGARIDRALAAGQIFAPSEACVYDLYKREYASNRGSSALARVAPRIRAALAPVADEAFARWYRDSEPSVDWPGLERTCEFLWLLDPDTKQHRMRELYAIAQQSIDSRDYARALSSYEEALKLDPSWVLALNGIGKVYMIESSPLFNERLGVAYYERAAAADRQFTWAAKNLGDYAIRKRDYGMAERYLLQALASSPGRPSILRALGFVYRRTGRRAEAIAHYEQSLAGEKDAEKIAVATKALAALRNGAE